MNIVNLIGSNAILCFVFYFEHSIFKFMHDFGPTIFKMSDITATYVFWLFFSIDK